MTDPNVVLENPDAAARDAKVKRDSWGRYILPSPVTGKQQAWTRVTTFADVLTEKFALHSWDERNIAWGMAQRPDLVAEAASYPDPHDDRMNGIIKQAKEASRASAPANMGTAIHRFAERVDADELGLAAIPLPDIRDAVVAYVDTLDAAGIAVMPEWIERIVLLPELGVAGTLDRLVNGMWGMPRVGDLKTGKDVLRFGMTKIPLQLALYAHATHWYDPATDTMGEMPNVDLHSAMVMHVPAGQARCDLYEVDIAAGWRAVELARQVRDWRKIPGGELAKLVTPLREQPALELVHQTPTTPPPTVTTGVVGDRPVEPERTPAPGLSTDEEHNLRLADHFGLVIPEDTPGHGKDLRSRIAWVQARVQRIKDHGGDPYQLLAQLWAAHPDIPTFKQGGPTTNDQIDAISAMCDTAEAGSELPFGPPDPGQPHTTKATRR